MSDTAAVTQPLESLNYQQLYYFWVVAREGGLMHAGRALRLSHPTLHAHVRGLEERLGEKLFTKVGRRLVLTETGQVVHRYADDIFSLGREMLDTIRTQRTTTQPRLRVGVVDVVPKLIVRELLKPVLAMAEAPRVVCQEAGFEELLSELGLHRLDVVIADAIKPAGSAIRAFHHPLGECETGIFGSAALAKKYRKGFPHSLSGAPMLVPLERLPARRALDEWMAANGVTPHIVGEFQDSALLKVFGAEGLGLFPAPMAVADDVARQYDVQLVGRIAEITQRFFAISLERRLHHPAVLELFRAARAAIFGVDS